MIAKAHNSCLHGLQRLKRWSAVLTVLRLVAIVRAVVLAVTVHPVVLAHAVVTGELAGGAGAHVGVV